VDNRRDWAHCSRVHAPLLSLPDANPSSPRQNCGLGGYCTPIESSLARPEHDALVCSHAHVKRGETLYRLGDRLSSIYPIKAGCFRVSAITERGDHQVIGFYLRGEILGLDAVATQSHTSTATALEDSEVCIVPFEHFERLCAKSGPLQQHFHKMMSREISVDRNMMLLLGSMNAEERVVSFLLSLSARLVARGYSPVDFNLRMSREDIGSHLGLKLETVSRTLSSLHEQRLLDVDGRHFRVLDVPGLKRLVGEPESAR